MDRNGRMVKRQSLEPEYRYEEDTTIRMFDCFYLTMFFQLRIPGVE